MKTIPFIVAASVLGVLGLAGTTHGAGQYATVEYPASTAENELQVGVTYTLWIPEGVKTLRGVIVHQHGAGTTASKEGATAAYDLHWQALAKKWDCALLGPSYHVLNEKNDITPGGSELWFDPRRGSEKAFLKALDDLGAKSEHPELKTVPWVLLGHSGGGIWSDVMTTLHPDRVVAVWMRSGTALMFLTHAEFTRPKVPDALAAIPMMCNPGVKEKPMSQEKPGAEDKRMVEEKMKGPWLGSLATFKEYRAKGVPIGLAPDPRTGHECGDSRYLAIPFLDACLALRLPDKGAKDQTLKPLDQSKAWLAPLLGEKAEPAASYQGNPKEAVWLPNEAVAKAWMEYVKTGAVSDTTPPPAPTSVRVWPKGEKGEKGTEIVWSAEADFESGIRCFIVLRDGQELAQVPKTPVGKFGRPLFQSMTYHDTPAQPLPEMRYLDTSAQVGAKHDYQVVTVNSVGLKSEPSEKASPYPRVNMSTAYQVDAAWPEQSKDLRPGAMSGVAVDAQDNVWVLARKDPPVRVYQADGKFLRAWGTGLLDTPHQLRLDRQGNVWLADSGNHVVIQCTPEGKVIRTLGTRGKPGCDESHFNRPADMVVSPEGDVFVADGYGNARVVHFDKNGKFVKAWGKLGAEPGEFSLPHSIAMDSRGRLYVADRNNVRIQVFDQDGKFLDQWRNIVVPCSFWMTKDDELWVCGSSPMPWRADDKVLGYPPVNQLFMKFNTSGKLLQLWAVPKGEDGKERPGELNWVHGLALDSKGNIYAVDIMGQRAQKFVPREPQMGLKSEPSPIATPQKEPSLVPFDGEKSSWHGFDRYDFLLDEQTLEIKPAVKGKGGEKGQRQCIVVVPKKAAAGNPWSWRGCYWDHEPQTEVELLKRGFHIAFVAPDAGAQGKVWDTWYKFLTEKHGLAKKAAFIGMSKGGVNEFNWGAVNPDKVACIYADNPALYDADFAKIPALAKHDVPLLHVCGSEDFLVQRHTRVVEDMYHQLGGQITVIVKEGHAHHPHSLQNPKLIADWIEQHLTPSTANRPAFVDEKFTKGYYYSLEPSFIYLKEEDTYATARGPGFTECYDRYDGGTSGTFKTGGISIIVPKTVAPGKPWVFTGDPIERDATVEQALLAKGYHILIVSPLGSGMTQKQWDDAYKLLVDNGFSKKPVLKGTGAMAGEAYAWAVANPDKVSCIYARNPLMKSLMAGKEQPIDHLAALAKAGVPVLHDCGALDPWLDKQTRVVEKRYKELDGKITVIVREGEGHFPLSPKDPKSVVDFIIKNAPTGAAQPKSTAIPVKGDAPLSLYGGGAASRDDCVKKQAGDSFRWTGSGQITWKVQVDQAGDYEVALNHAAEPGAVGQHVQISSGSSRVEYTMAKTKGVFGDRSYEMTPIKDRLHLEAGTQSITLSIPDAPKAMAVLQFRSLELIPVAAKAAIEADRQEARRARASTEWMAKAGYGLMFHWTSQSVGKDGTHKSYARAVDDFDVKRFAEMVEATGAGYVILTIGHAESYCPAPLKAWEKYHPGKTTQRDLIAEMADALNAKGIKLMCYLNAASLTRYPRADEEEFTRIMTEVVTEFGQRYKEKVAGYWIDCCYQAKEKYPGFSFREFFKVCKAGNPDRLLALNSWIYPNVSEWQEYWAGETASPVGLPLDGTTQEHGPGAGLRYHALLIMEPYWVQEKVEMPKPRFTAQQLGDYISQCKAKGGAVTINLGIYQDGTVDPNAVDVLKEVHKRVAALNSEGPKSAPSDKAAEAAKPNFDKKSPYYFDGTISRQTLENYLDHSITMGYFLVPGEPEGYKFPYRDDDVRMIHNLGAKFIGRAIYRWGQESKLGDPAFLEYAKKMVDRVHTADPEVVFQGCLFEQVTTDINKLKIPAWVFTDFGLPVEDRTFSCAAIIKREGRPDRGGGRGGVPIINNLETRLWFYYVAVSYLNLGCEALHLGQVGLIGADDKDLKVYSEFLAKVRTYAKLHARRHLVLMDGHVPTGGMVKDGVSLLDFNSFPMRIKAVPGKPQEAILEVGHLDAIFKRSKGCTSPSGWKCDSLPYLVEFDNFGRGPNPNVADPKSMFCWGWDEISWFAQQPEEYRNQWLLYAHKWIKQTDPNGHLEMPGIRMISCPNETLRTYFANTKSSTCPVGYSQEETIKKIWKNQGQSPPP